MNLVQWEMLTNLLCSDYIVANPTEKSPYRSIYQQAHPAGILFNRILYIFDQLFTLYWYFFLIKKEFPESQGRIKCVGSDFFGCDQQLVETIQ